MKYTDSRLLAVTQRSKCFHRRLSLWVSVLKNQELHFHWSGLKNEGFFPLTVTFIFVLLFPFVLGGFSCLSNPCLHGVCIDDVNSTYLCYCIDGYTGVHCQTNWDECWSNPCLNGGICHDQVAAFNCSCPDGFEGDICELNINECESNPCHNNGTCVDGANGYSCICRAGYLGDFCETDISVCNDTEETRCLNGGLCVEGPGITFNCVCPQGWTGTLCEDAVDECASTPCRNGAVCVDLHANYTCACPFGYTGRNCEVELEMCGEHSPCQNDALCLVEDSYSVCYCVPDFHGDRCQFQYDECLLGPGCKNGGSCIDGVDQYTCSCPADLTGDLCECLIINEDEIDCSYIRPTTTTLIPPSTSTETEYVTYSMVPNVTKVATPTEVPITTLLFPEEVSTTIETASPTIPGTTDLRQETSTITTWFRDITTFFFSTSTTEEPLTTPETTEKHFTITKPTMEPPKDLVTHTSELSTSTEITIEEETTSSPPATDRIPKSEISTDFPKTIVTEEETITSSTALITEITSESSTEITTETLPRDCRKIPCLNGGTCLYTTEGPRCVCKPDWEGLMCEKRVVINIAAFTGQSYLSHHLTNTSKTRIDLTARTLSPVGVILYAHLGKEVYMSLYLDEGLLKFKFSCGVQTMLLSEVQFHINNGFDLIVTVILEFLPPIRTLRHCAATVRINNTLAMSGEQMAKDPQTDLSHAWVHIGGVPARYIDRGEAPVMEGFTGCMQNLVIDGTPKGIYKDAFDGNEVTECLSLACLSNPCYSGSTCIEYKNSWSCLCPSGFSGAICERSVCENNPCEFGGTCVPFPGSGFLCLCPLGKHGLFCEHDLDIGHPVFSSSVGGLSSFLAYNLPAEIHHSVELKFKFIPYDMEQISLMLFVGQDGYHGPTSDHLSVSFIKGYIVLTWNLGSGARRIFTSHPISDTGLQRAHLIKLGRIEQKAWLAVDELGNVTGRSPGKLTQLNTRSILFLGGHDSTNFSYLPHDLPLHTGFSGCIYDVELKTGQMSIRIQKTKAVSGRSVGQCGTSLCHEHACENGGGCIHHGSTFTCLCAEGWFGPTCALSYNPCDSSRHNCSSGSTCVPQVSGYECDCPVGQSGQFCEIREKLSDVRFKGVRSYLSLPADGLHQHQSSIDLEVRPFSNQGLLLYSGRADGLSFMSLSLQGGVLELRVSSGKQRRRGELLVIRSRRLLATGKWHKIRAGRYGRRLFLWVEGTVNTGVLLPGETLPPSGTPLHLGGAPDLSTLPPGTVAGNLVPFNGCIRRLAIQWKRIPLNITNIIEGRNIYDCDGTTCGGDVCEHGGTCWIDENNEPQCSCPKQYTGKKCETQVSCTEIDCQNGGRCVQDRPGLIPRCRCPIGWGGAFCESSVTIETPHFGGASYILIDRTKTASKRRDIKSKINVDFLYLNFTTAQSNGLILWSSQPNGIEYIGIGVEDGILKLVWAWEGYDSNTVLVPGGSVSDGIWHDLGISLDSQNITLWSDHHTINTGNRSKHPNRPIATDGLFYLGGFPGNISIANETKNHFSSPFNGCIQKLAWSTDAVIIDFKHYVGENIGTCDPFQP